MARTMVHVGLEMASHLGSLLFQVWMDGIDIQRVRRSGLQPSMESNSIDWGVGKCIPLTRRKMWTEFRRWPTATANAVSVDREVQVVVAASWVMDITHMRGDNPGPRILSMSSCWTHVYIRRHLACHVYILSSGVACDKCG